MRLSSAAGAEVSCSTRRLQKSAQASNRAADEWGVATKATGGLQQPVGSTVRHPDRVAPAARTPRQMEGPAPGATHGLSYGH